MGQKIHPLGFRLGYTQEHRSRWFARHTHYSRLLQEDKSMRDSIQEYVKRHVKSDSNYGGLSSIQIHRQSDLVRVQICTAFPGILAGKHKRGSAARPGPGLEQLRLNVQSALRPENRKLRMTLVEIERPYGEAIILAEYITLQLESRVAFRKTIKKAIELANKGGGVNGIQIQIAGRLNGAEIARVEWAREGRVPLQTLRARINYCQYPAHTIYGILGIKVWLFYSSHNS